MSNAYRAVVQSGGGAAVGDATAADVLTGKTFSGAVGSGVSGTMPNNGAVSQTIQPGGSYTIPEGYHDGTGSVTAAAAKAKFCVQSDNAYAYWYGDECSGGSTSDPSIIGYERTSKNGSKTFSFGTVTISAGTNDASKIVCPAGCVVYNATGEHTSDGVTPIDCVTALYTGQMCFVIAP